MPLRCFRYSKVTSLSGYDAGDAPFPHPVLRIYFLVVLRLLSFDLLRSNGLARANRQSIYVLKHSTSLPKLLYKPLAFYLKKHHRSCYGTSCPYSHHRNHPPSKPLLDPSTNALASPTAPSFILSTSLSALLSSSGTTNRPNSILRCLFLCAPLASRSANSASSPFLSACFFAASRDSAVTGGIAMVIVKGSVGEVV